MILIEIFYLFNSSATMDLKQIGHGRECPSPYEKYRKMHDQQKMWPHFVILAALGMARHIGHPGVPP